MIEICFFFSFVLFSFLYTFSSENVVLLLFFLIYSCFWLCSLFVAARGLSLGVESRVDSRVATLLTVVASRVTQHRL